MKNVFSSFLNKIHEQGGLGEMVRKGIAAVKKPENRPAVMAAGAGVGLVSAVVVLAFAYSVAVGGGGITEAGFISASMSGISRAASSSASASKTDTVLSLHGNSVEADLEVQIRKEDGSLATGFPFSLTVRNPSGTVRTFLIDTLDGFLYLSGIAAGDYTVEMEDMAGFVTPAPITVTVKPKVVYEAIADIEEKVVDESTINVPKEDASYGNTTAPSTPANTDTVEYVASSDTEREVEKDKVKVQYIPVCTTVGGLPSLNYAAGGVSDIIVEENDGVYTGYRLVAPSASAATAAKNRSVVSFLGTAPAKAQVRLLSDISSAPPTDSSAADSTPSVSIPPQSTSPESTPPESTSPDSTSPDSTSPDSSSADSSTPPASSDSGSDSGSSSAPDPVRQNVPLFDDEGVPLKDGNGTVVYAFTRQETTVRITETEHDYTGWQTLNGKTYYFDKHFHKVTGWQVIQGVNYFFNNEGVRADYMGIDVSKWQGAINWGQVKASGVSFVMIRAGYRGYGSGALVEDPSCRANISGAKAAGLKVGLYFFSQAVTTAEAVEEASLCITLARGVGLEYPIAFDTEYVGDGARADTLSTTQRTAVAVAFCETVRNSGYTPCVYASKSWLIHQLDVSRFGGYRIWLAHYISATDYAGRYEIWQYSSTGSIAGIGTAVDMNISYMGY